MALINTGKIARITFDPGGTRFAHIVGNIDVTKRLSDMFSFAFGSEFRSEDFTVIEGELAFMKTVVPTLSQETTPVILANSTVTT
ncbi:MAG: hypothetical protein R2795_01155 [Saprospiraceae bacterium]